MARQGDNIYKRKDKRYEGRYIIGRNPDRTPRFGYVYGKSYAEVKEKLLPLKLIYRRPQNGIRFTGTFSDYVKRWLEIMSKEKNLKPSTYISYYGKIYNHIIPILGDKLPHMLKKSDVENFMDKLSDKGLSAGTITNVFRLLSVIISKAQDENVIVENICKGIRKPYMQKRKITVLSRNAQYLLERSCEKEKTGILPLLALYTGMRVGEISALKWSDVDLDEGLLYVKGTAQRITKHIGNEKKTKVYIGAPKTASSERVIALSPRMIDYLLKHKETADSEYVISCKGHIAEPRVCQYRFEVLLKKAGIGKVSFHSLRHTYATRCLEQGIDVKTLSQLMGHSGVEMTLKYGDSMIEHKKRAVLLLDNMCQIAV